jgi:RHS repeat-associated protein
MKMKHIVLAIGSTAILLSSKAGADNALPAPLPEFMDQAQLSKWNASQTTQASSKEISTAFYTGKPYVPDAGGYIFKYRTYSPESAHWNSADPSGFPDGANNQATFLFLALHLIPMDLSP